MSNRQELQILRLKLLGLVIFTTLTIYVQDFWILLSLLILMIIFIIVIRSRNNLSERVSPLISIFFLILIFQIVFNTSLDLFSRIGKGFIAGLKILNLSLLVFFFTATTPLSRIGSVFSFLPKSMRLMLTITLSLIPVVFEEAKKITIAQNSRGYNTRQLNPIRSIMHVLIPLIHRILRRSEQIAMVLESRGYGND